MQQFYSDTSTLRVPDDALNEEDNDDGGVEYEQSSVYRGYNT